MIKHVSFDVWNTLIKPNPEFSLNRTKFIAIALNLDVEYVKHAYTKVKAFVDGCAENSDGAAFTTPEVYQLFFKALGVSVSPGLAREIRLTIDHMFIQYPPVLAADATDLMTWLADQQITTSIGSNSNFISGNVMHPFLERVTPRPFLYGVYSDLLVAAKPGSKFFDAVYEQILLKHTELLDRANVLHVGDNPVCDVEGAQNADMNGLLIESPDLLCQQVKLRIERENGLGVSFSQ
jgi:putative hydrolase of the HAD superfamily